MVGRQKRLKRERESGPHDYVKSLGRFKDSLAVKKNKYLIDGLADLEFHCCDGQVQAHQIIMAGHSKFIKKLLLSQHNFEFGIIDWDKGLAQLTGLRCSDKNIVIFLPDFSKEDVKRLLSCFYLGEIILENEVQSMALKNLWKTLCIDSMKLSDLSFIELDAPTKRSQPPKVEKADKVDKPSRLLYQPAESNVTTQPHFSRLRFIIVLPHYLITDLFLHFSV